MSMGTRFVHQQECDRCGELVESIVSADDTMSVDVPDGWGDLHDEHGAGFTVCGSCLEAFHQWVIHPDGKRLCAGCDKWFIRLEGHVKKMHPEVAEAIERHQKAAPHALKAVD